MTLVESENVSFPSIPQEASIGGGGRPVRGKNETIVTVRPSRYPPLARLLRLLPILPPLPIFDVGGDHYGSLPNFSGLRWQKRAPIVPRRRLLESVAFCLLPCPPASCRVGRGLRCPRSLLLGEVPQGLILDGHPQSVFGGAVSTWLSILSRCGSTLASR